MHLGDFVFATDCAIRIDELVRTAEDRGFESLLDQYAKLVAFAPA